jgi:osmotically inducible protein OsmC
MSGITQTPDIADRRGGHTMAAIRRAEVTWTGDLMSGSGAVSAASSGAFSDLPVSWASRTEGSDGRTSPEELVAAAHSSCYAMAFSGGLARNGTPPEQLSVSAEVTFDKVDDKWTVTASALTVRGVVPGLSNEDFVRLAEAARDGCPISRALAGNVALSVDAALAS